MERRCLTSPGIIFCYEDLTTWKYFTERESTGVIDPHLWNIIILLKYFYEEEKFNI